MSKCYCRLGLGSSDVLALALLSTGELGLAAAGGFVRRPCVPDVGSS